MAKKTKTPDMNFIQGMFRPMFEDKLELKKAYTVRFRCFKMYDLVEFEGNGEDRYTDKIVERKCKKAKLSENREHELMIIRNIKKHVEDCAVLDTNVVKSSEGLINKKELEKGDEPIFRTGDYFWTICYCTFDFLAKTIKTEVHYVTKSGQKSSESFISTF